MSSFVERFQSRLQNLKQRANEREELVRAIQAGDVDAFIVLQKHGATVYPARSEEPLYRSIIEELPLAVATILSDGTIVYANNAVADLFGTEAKDLVAQTMLDRVVEADRGRLTSMLKKALQAHEEGEFTLIVPTGEKRAFLVASRLEISGVDAIALVIADIANHVARRVAEKTATARDEVFSAVSHELRTPLTSMLGWVQLLEFKFRDDKGATHDLLNLKTAIQSQIKIVNDLVELAQAEKQTARVAAQTLDLRRSIMMAIDVVTLAANNKRIAIRADLPLDPLLIDGDPDRLGQVMLHLLSNAVKFSLAGGEIIVRAARVESDIEVTVTDHGVGIAAEFLPFIFEPFRRSGTGPGLGIGLALARRIVESHGGTIHVVSEGEWKGATFVVHLPVANKLRM